VVPSPSSPSSDIVNRWLVIDPDPLTRQDLASIRQADPDRGAALFDGRIAFGTAGLRAAIGPGPRQMNRVVVRQTTAGLAKWLRANSGPGTVVIGFDARHYSDVFAQDAARELAAAGFRAELLTGPTATPVLAYAVLDRGAMAGIMITASHNPPADNGYKLYLDDGIQLVSPADAEIAAAIDDVAAAHDELAAGALAAAGGADPVDLVGAADGAGAAGSAAGADAIKALRSATVTEALGLAAATAGEVVQLDTEPQRRHRQAAIEALLTDHRDVGILYTAMHGVGGEHLLDCFREAGFPTPAVVPEQFEPDPGFPTADFPNPEEPGALDLAYAQAAAADPAPDAILANDPDADRLAVAVPDDEGMWRRLTGDEVGALFLDHVFRHRAGVPNPVVASSIVSSRLINDMAAARGAESVRTLTGFKWVARPMVEQPDATYLMGYEEALGYCIGDRVRDKDGVSAALVMAEIVAGLKAEGQTVRMRLDQLACEYGLFATAQVTVSFVGMTESEQADLRRRGTTLRPDEVAGTAVAEVEHLAEGRHLPPTDGVVVDLVDRSRIIVRPSGTEPKMKVYLEVIEPVSDEDVEAARGRAGERLAALSEAMGALLRS
jgi:phosphomannomutase